MGATDFTCEAHGTTADEAFNAARDSAAWEHGHGGYTGTIAEKDGFIFYGKAPESFDTAWALASAIGAAGYDEETDPRLVEAFGSKLGQIANTYNDKWGPACCFQLGEGSWLFCGLASC